MLDSIFRFQYLCTWMMGQIAALCSTLPTSNRLIFLTLFQCLSDGLHLLRNGILRCAIFNLGLWANIFDVLTLHEKSIVVRLCFDLLGRLYFSQVTLNRDVASWAIVIQVTVVACSNANLFFNVIIVKQMVRLVWYYIALESSLLMFQSLWLFRD